MPSKFKYLAEIHMINICMAGIWILHEQEFQDCFSYKHMHTQDTDNVYFLAHGKISLIFPSIDLLVNQNPG